MASRRLAAFWLLVLAPAVVLTTRGRGLAPCVRKATLASIGAGFAASLIATVVFFLIWEFGDWEGLYWFAILILPAIMASVEALCAALMVAPKWRRRALRFVVAFAGAALGHVVWLVLLLSVPLVSALGETLEIIALIHAPAAVLGGSGATIGAALAAQPASGPKR